MAVPFRGAEQADIAIQVVQQLLSGFVECRPDADAAEAGNGISNGLVRGHAVQPRLRRRRLFVEGEDVVLNGVQRLDVQTHSILQIHPSIQMSNTSRQPFC